jgi:hypothetical protein
MKRMFMSALAAEGDAVVMARGKMDVHFAKALLVKRSVHDLVEVCDGRVWEILETHRIVDSCCSIGRSAV